MTSSSQRRRIDALLLDYPSTDSLSSTSVLFCELCEIISRLCDLSASFMANKFKDNVWPLLARLLGFQLKLNFDYVESNVSSPITASVSCIESCMKCISRAFSSRTCGEVIADLIPNISTVLLPFLSDRDRVGDATFSALQSMLKINYCSIFRQLCIIAKEKCTASPFHRDNATSPSQTIVRSSKCASETIEAKRATDLIKFIHYMEESDLAN